MRRPTPNEHCDLQGRSHLLSHRRSHRRSQQRFLSLARIFCLTATVLTLTACISYESHHSSPSRPTPTANLLDTIELGETTTTWLATHLGEPDAIRRPNDRVRVWQYEQRANKTTNLRAFPLIAVSLSDEVRTVFNFEIENDCIVKYWQTDQPAD